MGSVNDEIELLTKNYINQTNHYATTLDEHNAIDLDTETRNFFIERMSVLITSLNHIKSNTDRKLPKWQELLSVLGTFQDLLCAKQNEKKKKIYSFFESDLWMINTMMNRVNTKCRTL